MRPAKKEHGRMSGCSTAHGVGGWKPNLKRVALACVAVAAVWTGPACAADLGDLAGVWLNTAPASTLVPAYGRRPPLNRAGRTAYAKAQAELKSGKAVDAVDAVAKYCLPEGVPRLMMSPYPMKLIGAQGQLTVVHESHHTFRIVLMDGVHPDPDDIVTTYMGDSVGRWDGDALVIDTVGFNANEPLDASGLPHGERLHVVERLRRLPDGGLENLITIDDPEFYERPWTVRAAYSPRPDLRLQEYACGEPHRPLPVPTRAR